MRSVHHQFLTASDVDMVLFQAVTNAVQVCRSDQHSAQQESDDILKVILPGLIERAFESIPRKLCVHFPLTGFDGLAEGAIPIHESITLHCRIERPWSPPPGQAGSPGTHSKPHAWLTVDTEGVLSLGPDSMGNSLAITAAKQCLYFFESLCHPHPLPAASNSVAYVMGDGDCVLLRLPEFLLRYMQTLVPDWQKLRYYEPGGTLLGGRMRPPENEGERLEALPVSLHAAKGFFEQCNNPDYPAIAAAMEWYVDSKTAENQTFSYLAACIGVEAILGEDGAERMETMTARLSDRYGFLLGVGRQDRKRLAEEYYSVLKLRGTLVHARRKRLTQQEQGLLHKAQALLRALIDKEVRTLTGTTFPV